MNPALTPKNHLSVPTKIRTLLGLRPGKRIKLEPMADGRVAIAPVEPRKQKMAVDPPVRYRLPLRAKSPPRVHPIRCCRLGHYPHVAQACERKAQVPAHVLGRPAQREVAVFLQQLVLASTPSATSLRTRGSTRC